MRGIAAAVKARWMRRQVQAKGLHDQKIQTDTLPKKCLASTKFRLTGEHKANIVRNRNAAPWENPQLPMCKKLALQAPAAMENACPEGQVAISRYGGSLGESL